MHTVSSDAITPRPLDTRSPRERPTEPPTSAPFTAGQAATRRATTARPAAPALSTNRSLFAERYHLRGRGIHTARARTTALFVLVVLVMGSGYVAIRVGVATVPPLLLGAVRLYLAGVVLLGVAFATGMPWRPRTRPDVAAIAVLGLLVFAGAIGFLFVGQQRTTAGVAAVVMCLGPVLTALIARALLPAERLTTRQAAGVALGLLGAVVVAVSATGTVADGAGFGAAFVLCAAVSGSLGSVLLGRIQAAVPPTVQAGWGALLGGVVLHAASFTLGEPAAAVPWTPTQVGLVLYLSVAVSGLGYVALLRLLRAVGPTRSSFTSYGSPVVAVVLGSVLLHEPLSTGTVAGFATIVTGFILLNGNGGPPPANDASSRSPPNRDRLAVTVGR